MKSVVFTVFAVATAIRDRQFSMEPAGPGHAEDSKSLACSECDKYAEYLTSIENEGKKEVTREMKAKRKEELDKQLEENKQLKQKEKEKIAQEEEKRQKDLNRQGQIEIDRQREKQLRQKKEQERNAAASSYCSS